MEDRVKAGCATVLIVIPVYNGEKYLQETIESCLQQTYQDIFIVIVNDCSSDSSMKIIEGYSNLKNVMVLQNNVNMGINKTVNRGARAYNSKYILFLGQDDILPSNYIEDALTYFDRHTAFVYCNPYIIDRNGFTKGKIMREEGIKSGRKLQFHMAKQNCIMSTGLIMNNKLCRAAGIFDEKYRNYGEWKLWIKLMNKGKAVYASGISSQYRKHLTNISNSFTNNTDLATLKEQHKYWSECRLDAIKSFRFSFPDKCHLIIYYYQQWVKYKLEELKVAYRKYISVR